MNTCYLGLGSNQKSPQRQIRAALNDIKKIPSTHLIQVSSLYRSRAWGFTAQQDFYNVVIEINTRLDPFLLLRYCHVIEEKQQRVRKKKWGPRTIDIDIILYGQRTINAPNLTIPHPYYKQRTFVMNPLMELNPRINLTLDCTNK
jgi:2-amino-4-hydroxy-6-hydroxymethyldihydropteridine diphosphokinase